MLHPVVDTSGSNSFIDETQHEKETTIYEEKENQGATLKSD